MRDGMQAASQRPPPRAFTIAALKLRVLTYHSAPLSVRVGVFDELLPAAADANVEGAILGQ